MTEQKKPRLLIFDLDGTLLKNDLVWELQDMFNQLMVFPNIIALFALSGTIAASAVPPETGK